MAGTPQAAKTKAAAAKQETQDHKTLAFGGEQFTVPPEIPFTFAAFLQEGEMLNAIRGLLEPGDLGRFMEAARGMSIPQVLEAINDACMETYGVDAGG